MEQPTKEQQKELLDINDDRVSKVKVDGRKKSAKVGYIKPFCQEQLTRLMVEEDITEAGTEVEALRLLSKKSPILHKFAAYAILNNFYKIKLFYWIKWRWMYYIEEWTYDQLLPIILEAKKKIQAGEFATGIVLAGQVKETRMMMTKQEAEQYQAELLSALGQHSERNTLGR